MSSKSTPHKGLSRKIFALSLSLLLWSQLSDGQYRYGNRKEEMEIGVFAGISTYQGDLTDKAIMPVFFRPGFGAFGRFYLSNHFAIRPGFSYGTVTASDAYGSNLSRWKRNLSFKSNIMDVYTVVEYIPFVWKPSRYSSFFPYLSAGIAVFHFNPQALYKGQWYNLHDLSTEGQGLPQYPLRNPYHRTQFSMPFGFGLRYKFNYSWSIGIDIRDYKTYTDYIDDVSGTYASNNDILQEKGSVAAALADRSPEVGWEPHKARVQRGNDKVKDYYIFSGITLAYTPHKKVKCFQF